MTGGLKTNILFDLYNKISILLPRIGLPIRFYERREYSGHSFEATMSGLNVRLSEDTRDNLEDNFPISSQFSVDGQIFKYSIYVFKENSSDKFRKNEGVIFSINGQSQGFFSTSFFKRNSIRLDYIADSILVMVDCSDINKMVREDLFMNSRDRLTEGDLRGLIESELEEILGANKGLKKINNIRRQKMAREKVEDSKPLKEVLEKIINKSPSLQALFKTGGDFSNPFMPTDLGVEELYIGKDYPSYFRLLKGEAEKECHINQRFRVQFETDVIDDYFYRERYPGKFLLKINGEDNNGYTLNPWKGIYTLNVSVPSNLEIGDIVVGEVTVSGELQTDDFKIEFLRKVISESHSGTGVKGKRKNRDKDGFALPNIYEIYEDDWKQCSFNEFSGLDVKSDGNNGFDYYVNMDNKYLLHEIKNQNQEHKSSLMKSKYKFSLVLIGMALLKDRELFESTGIFKSGDNDYGKLINHVTSSLSPIIIPMIDSLSKLDMD